MSDELKARVAAAVELSNMAIQGEWRIEPTPGKTWLKLVSDHCTLGLFQDLVARNADFIAASHTHVDLIRDLHAALLASEEAREKAEVDARRWHWVLDNATRSAIPAYNAKTSEQTGLFLQLTFPLKGASPWATQETLCKAIDTAMKVTHE